jgi:cell division protein FtsL
MNERTFQWVVGIMMAVIISLIGFIVQGFNARIDMEIVRLNAQISGETSRLNRANNRVNSVCERLASVEYQLRMSSGTCTSGD